MCGIAGFVDFDARTDQTTATQTLNGMRHALRRRGPDDEGSWIDPHSGVGLAHTRLAVIDLSANGHQPMASSSGRYQITFNGEIYNYREIATTLSASGFSPKGGSDTEVLLAALEQWGLEKTLQLLNGMFAFAIWDKKDNTLYLARDRMGEKPLYYGWLGREFVFASQLNALEAHPKWDKDICRNALSLFMRYAYIPAPHSIYKGIYKLPPACYLSIPAHNPNLRNDFSAFPDGSTEQNRPRKYWDLCSVANSGIANRDSESTKDYVDTFQNLLSKSVKSQMVADVPIGAFLSGGIDSSLIVALMQSHATQPIKTFTIGFDVNGFDEAPFARAVADHIGTEHIELYVSGNDTIDVVPSLADVYDEPHADPSDVPSILVSRLARQDVTVCVSGDGGDELFCGYNRYLHSDRIWRSISKYPAWLRKLAAQTITSVAPSTWDTVSRIVPRSPPRAGYKLHKLADSLHSKDVQDVYRRLISAWQEPSELVLSSSEPDSFFASENTLNGDMHFTDQMAYWDQVAYLPDDNLAKMDRASMSVGLESRAPLLDRDIVEFSWNLPFEMKISSGQSKRLMRDLLYRYVPRKLIERPKMGFSIPIGEWLRGPMMEWCEDTIHYDTLSHQGLLDPSLVHQLWREHKSGRVEGQNALWAVLMFQSWLARR